MHPPTVDYIAEMAIIEISQIQRKTWELIEMEKHDIRISIHDLVAACRALGECTVLAAGSMYATLSLDQRDCRRLTYAGIDWQFD